MKILKTNGLRLNKESLLGVLMEVMKNLKKVGASLPRIEKRILKEAGENI